MKKNRDNISSFTLLIVFIVFSILGAALLPLLPIKLLPSDTLPGLTISYNMDGSSSRVIESEVTSAIEGVLSRVNGVNNISSTSDNNKGSITIDFDKGMDMNIVRFEVSSIIRQIWPSLPSGVSYPEISARKVEYQSELPFLSYSINAPMSSIDILRYADDNIKPILSNIEGIDRVELRGATPTEWRLIYDYKKLERLGVSAEDIQYAIQQQYDTEFLGLAVERDNSLIDDSWVRVMRCSVTDDALFDPSTIFLKRANGENITLDKLVKVYHLEEKPQSYFRINGLNSIYIYITADSGANQLTVGKQVKSKLSELQKALPADYELSIDYDSTEYINLELDKIYLRTGMTVLILLLFIALVSHSIRYIFLIVASLAVNLAVAVILYYFLGIELQLYSLAGIVISLNLIIDNTIVMIEHNLHKNNRKIAIAILASTLTTIGALAIIFLLDDSLRSNLQDFAVVVIVNLALSFIVSLFFVPALMEKVKLNTENKYRRGRIKSIIIIKITHLYGKLIYWLNRYKRLVFILVLLAFGLPTFLIPKNIKGDSEFALQYNNIVASTIYTEDIKPIIDKLLGGSLRLFIEDVFMHSSVKDGYDQEPSLYISATLPKGSTIEKMNQLIKQVESHLSIYNEIEQFETTIYNANNASIRVFFTHESINSSFPTMLYTIMEEKLSSLGGGSWGISGINDLIFSNKVSESSGSFRVNMYGYSYDELYQYAEKLRSKLLEKRRINEVAINSKYLKFKVDYSEFYLNLDKEKMAIYGITEDQLFTTLNSIFGRDILSAVAIINNNSENIKLSSVQQYEYDIWGLMNIHFTVNGIEYKLSDFASIQKEQSPPEIIRENQQYSLCLQYEYIGMDSSGERILNEILEEFQDSLPMGYTTEAIVDNNGWSEEESSQYWYLFIVIIIIFFTTSILFNSLKQPFAIILVIPISFIGVFLSFYHFKFNFDQGGFAALILLSGITVNASIYILYEYNKIRTRYPQLTQIRAYCKAWNHKVIPILLTVLSTVLGFIPFLIGDKKESFWFALAVGSIGGVLASVLAIYLFLPLLAIKRNKKFKRTKR